MEVKENICGREPEPAKKVMSPNGYLFSIHDYVYKDLNDMENITNTFFCNSF